MIEKIIKEMYSIVEEDDAIKKFNEILETKDEEKIKNLFLETIFEDYFSTCYDCNKKVPNISTKYYYSDEPLCSSCYEKIVNRKKEKALEIEKKRKEKEIKLFKGLNEI